MGAGTKKAVVGLLAACLGLGGCAQRPPEVPLTTGGQPLAVTVPQAAPTAERPEPTADAPIQAPVEAYRAVAYVTVPASDNWRWIGTDGPGDNDAVSAVDTRYVTHINFAFGMIKAYQFEPGKPGCPLKEGRIASMEAYRDPADGQLHYRATLTGWIEEMDKAVDGREYVRALVALKAQKPSLRVLVSIGGWDSDGFCYMARTREGRAEFIESCLSMIEEYGLDGIDLDWEYPTNGAWGEIASCEHCVEDARALLVEFRQALDRRFPNEEKLLTIASGSGQPWVDGETFKALNYINVMCYDYDPGSGGSQAGMDVIEPGMAVHLEMVGDTPENRKKLNVGLPFYNEGGTYLVPYYKGWNGHVDASPQLVKEKMRWVKEQGYGGGFYWAYSMDVFSQDVDDPEDPSVKILQRTLYDTLMGS
jgi:GH18 family chitinase